MDREVLDANAGAEQAAQQLRVAAQGGQLEAVRQLLQEDAFCASSADGTDTEGRTALHLAALNRHLEIVQALLAHRAAVTADAEGETPLHHAAFSGRAAIVAELLAARASRTAENANGRTPLDYAQLKGSKEVLALLTAEPLVDEETASQEHPPSLLNILHFAIRQRPAVVEGADEISYHGHIKLGAAICYISFPGKYKAGWDALIAGLHGSSVACVFLCAAQDGLGQHAVDPDDPRGRCYCHRIYGERTYKEFGYLHFVKKKRTDCTDEEIRKIEEKAKAMNGVVVFADATPEERMEKEMEAQELWERHQRTASWGCAWYHVWLARVKQAVADGQRLKVVFFPGEVGLGKVTMRELASANLWDGIGCGGSQKCEIATIEAMRQLTGDPRWDYEGVDVGDFLLEQFRVGDHVEALDGQRWCQGRILEAPKEDLQKDQKPTWKIQCNWSSKEFLSEHIRPVTAETDGLQRLLEAFVDPSLQRVLERLSGLKLQAVQASDGRRSMAVQVKIENVREAQLLRDQVLSGELESVVNEVLSRHSTLKCFPWEIGLDKTAFFELYERTLMSLSDLTAHQQEKLEELESVENPVIHLSAPAGAGKTFVAVMHVLKRLEATGDGERRHLVLYVAPNKALLFHFLRWFMVFASTKTVRWRQHLARIVVMCQPYQKCMKPTITETRIQLDPVEASSEEFLLVVMDEAHHMFCSQTDLAQQEMLQKIPAQQKLLLSDVSQSDGSQKDLTFDRFFPDRYQVALSQVVRSTQRIVAGARAFQLSAADAVKSSSLGTDGPPVKSFIFEVEGKEGNASREEIMMHYVKYTMDAFWHLMQTFSTLSFDRRLSLLVPDERFREDFQRLLDLELQKEFPHRRFQLVTCEESLSYLPSHMMAVNAEVYAGESIVLDTIENAKGLEQLIVISIGLDGGQDGDRLTRARLYQGITRAQLVALVVNEFVEDGLLAFLSKVKLKGAQRFQPKAAFAEIRTDAAAALVASPPKKVSAEAPPLAVSAARPVPEEVLPIPATARTTGGSAAETSKELPPRRSSVWDTESNALGAGARAVAGRGLRFDPMESMLEAYQRAVTLMELELIRDAARSLKEAEDVNFYQFNQEHVLSKTAPPDGIVLRGVRAPPQVAQSLLRNRRGRRFRSSVHVTREIVQMDAQRLRSGAVGTTQGAEVMADGRLAVSVDVTHGSFVAGDGLFIDSIAVGGPEEIDLTGSISYKEFLSPKPCIAQWYCCHWWGESLDSFVSSCQTHAQLRRRGSPGSAGGYWVAAFAMRQHELREELGPDLKESPFYDALRLADGILLTVDSEEVFRRTWCHYELYAGSDLKHLDVVCNGAMLSRTGLPGESMVAKQLREKGFDWELLLKGLTMNCEASRATVLADRRMFAAIFDQEGTLKVDETVCSTFALLAWPQAVKRGLVSTQLIETVASDVNREALELSLAHLQEFQDPGMLQLAQSLPPNLTKLKLGLEGCHELTDQGVKALANRWGTKLKHLYLDFVGCGKLTDASLSVLAQNLPPTLTDLELHMAGCVLVGPPGMEHLKKHWPKSVKVFRASFKATKLNRNFMTLQDLEDYWRES